MPEVMVSSGWVLSINGKRYAFRSVADGRGRFFALPTVWTGGLTMVTFSDLIQTGILIIGLIDLVLRLLEADRNNRK